MKIGIMCAVTSEFATLAQLLNGSRVEQVLQRDFHIGELHGAQVVAVMGGVGKVNGAITAQLLAERYHVDVLIFTGAAGGLSDSLAVGDVVIGTRLLYHDLPMDLVSNEQFDTPADGFYSDPNLVEICKGLGLPLHYGTIVTGDAFITGGQQRDDIVSRLAPLCVDMESTAVAQVCWFYHIPILVIRAVSDFANDSADDTYNKNKLQAGSVAVSVLDRLVEGL